MKLRQFGDCKTVSKREFKYAADWMLKRLVGPQRSSRVRARLFHTRIPTYGAYVQGYYGDLWRYDIHIDPRSRKHNRTRRSMLVDLAHELVHVKQYTTRTMDDVDEVLVRWKKRCVRARDYPYRQQPWEVEAYRMMRPLYDAYARHLKREGLTFI